MVAISLEGEEEAPWRELPPFPHISAYTSTYLNDETDEVKKVNIDN